MQKCVAHGKNTNKIILKNWVMFLFFCKEDVSLAWLHSMIFLTKCGEKCVVLDKNYEDEI